MTPPVIVAARRTPIGTKGRTLSDVPVERLAAPVLRALLDDLGAQDVADVILGNCMGPGGNVARVAALAAGLLQEVPGLTIDRQCGSGLEAIQLAASLVQAGRGDLYLAGGAESASTAPTRTWPNGEPYQRAPFAPQPYEDPDMGVAADNLARRAGISRARQDVYAARSHALATAAAAAGRFDRELVPLAGLDRDERPRADLTEERLARLRPAFVHDGTVTAGNSCGVNDGAAAVAVVSGERRQERPGLRILDWDCVGVDPALPGIGPVEAIRRVLDRQSLKLEEIDSVELVEAFAGQVLACADALGLDPDRLCPDGGALALGHPWGASGAVAVVRLFTRLVCERRGELGIASAAVGGGMGLALLVQRVEG